MVRARATSGWKHSRFFLPQRTEMSSIRDVWKVGDQLPTEAGSRDSNQSPTRLKWHRRRQSISIPLWVARFSLPVWLPSFTEFFYSVWMLVLPTLGNVAACITLHNDMSICGNINDCDGDLSVRTNRYFKKLKRPMEPWKTMVDVRRRKV